MGEFINDNYFDFLRIADDQIEMENKRHSNLKIIQNKKVLYNLLTNRLSILLTKELFIFQDDCEDLLTTKNIEAFKKSLSGDFLKFSQTEITLESVTAFINCVNRQLAIRFRLKHNIDQIADDFEFK